MFDIQNVHKRNLVRHKVLALVDRGSISLAATVIKDNYTTLDDASAVLKDCSVLLSKSLNNELVELVQTLIGEDLCQAEP